ncbi:MAG: methionine synthase [Acidimicrobiia bacterium]|nr:methionine synthase [Acidimicrobiia bacterium]
MADYLDAIEQRTLIYDGGAGTSFQRMNLTAEDFGGDAFEGCNEILSVTRPDVVRNFHDSFLAIGSDVIETNTFGSFGVPLAEYSIADRAEELSRAAAEIAVDAAQAHSIDGRARFVAGSVGPGTKFPSLGQIRYAELAEQYRVQARGLLEGGVDLILIETQFDLLGLKAAVRGARVAMEDVGREVPLQTQVTIELTGRMLPGTEIGAALNAIEPLGVDVLGLNCATGPEEMWEPLRHLSRHSRRPISVLPNAGLPSVEDGEMVYDLTPEGLADHLAKFVGELGVSVVGGCCGTTPEHLAAVVERLGTVDRAPRDPEHEPGATSLYSPVPFDQDASFLIIGERTNTNGSKRFREALLADDVDGCVDVALAQIAESAHLVDVSVDYVGRDGTKDMDVITSRFATEVTAPIVLDSTESEVMEAGLQRIGGRSVLNSANLEDGVGPGSRIDKVFTLAKEHGSAVICLLIDEEGQARDVEWKMRVAHRIHDIAVDEYGLEPTDLIFDPLTFPLGTGDAALRQDAIETIKAIRRIKEELPRVYTVLGVSNVSFGLSPVSRKALNSVFLHECRQVGLDAAIVHAAKIVPIASLPDEQRAACLDLVWDSDPEALERFLEVFSDATDEKKVIEDRSGWPVDKRLEERIVDGDRTGLDTDLDDALNEHAPLDIINDILLAGMKRVGEMFASGEMQLPFVLKSAETMKAAVKHLEPHMDKSTDAGRGRIVLATVRGDVHDIGKNLVDIILTNNGFEVHNLGIKVEIADMIEKAAEVKADAIGMSGLLVKSTLIMRDNLEELTRRGLGDTPVLLGGAALTRRYVEADLRDVYTGPLYYGKDAFEGLRVMDSVVTEKREGTLVKPEARGRKAGDRKAVRQSTAVDTPVRSPEVVTDNPIPAPPFLGSRVVKGVPVSEIAEYLNHTALFRNQWQYRPHSGESDAEFKARLQPVLRERLNEAKAEELLVPQVVYGYFPANGDGNDLVIWADPERTEERTRLSFPRQSEAPFLCIADFFRPIDADEVDYAAFHIVTMGHRVSEHAAALFEADAYSDYLHTHGLGVEMAESLAELWHHRIREEWGFVDEDGPTLQGLFRQQYRGGRYSWGYPACPDLEDNATVSKLLQADRLGIECSQETGWQYQPEQTTSALICHHPRAKYFIAR